MQSTAFLLLAVLALGGCATFTVGHDFELDAVLALEVGRATTATVLATVGEPYRQRTGDNGAEQWIYFWSGAVETRAVLGPLVGRTYHPGADEKALVLLFCSGVLRSVEDVSRNIPAQREAIVRPVGPCDGVSAASPPRP